MYVSMYVCMCSWSLPSLFHSLPPSSIHPIHHDFFLGPSFVSPCTNRHKVKGWCPLLPPFPCLSFLFLPLPSFLQQSPTISLPFTLHVRSQCGVCVCVRVVSLLFCLPPPRTPHFFSFFLIVCIVSVSLTAYDYFFFCVFFVLCSFSYDHTPLRTRSRSPLTHSHTNNTTTTKERKKTPKIRSVLSERTLDFLRLN